MPDFYLTEIAHISPNACFCCGTDVGPFVDTGRDLSGPGIAQHVEGVVGYGRMYICTGTDHAPGCARQIATLIGCPTPGEGRELVQALENAYQEIDRVQATVTTGRAPTVGDLQVAFAVMEAKLLAQLRGDDPDLAGAEVLERIAEAAAAHEPARPPQIWGDEHATLGETGQVKGVLGAPADMDTSGLDELDEQFTTPAIGAENAPVGVDFHGQDGLSDRPTRDARRSDIVARRRGRQ